MKAYSTARYLLTTGSFTLAMPGLACTSGRRSWEMAVRTSESLPG